MLSGGRNAASGPTPAMPGYVSGWDVPLMANPSNVGQTSCGTKVLPGRAFTSAFHGAARSIQPAMSARANAGSANVTQLTRDWGGGAEPTTVPAGVPAAP